MLVRFTKGPVSGSTDVIECVRPDGSATSAEMVRQGILSHDAFHYVIETTLGWHDALFGQIARGASISEIVAKLHGDERGGSKMTQGLQCEALIESLQAEQWGGARGGAEFAQSLVLNCRRRATTPPDVTSEEIDRIRAALRTFGAAWRPLLPGESLERTF